MENKKISQLDPYSGNPDSFDIPGVADGQTLRTNLGAAIQQKITSERLLRSSDLKTVNGVPLTGQGDIALELAHPFKGWYDSLEGLQTAVGSPAVGDYAYIKGATTSDPAAIYECATAGTWSDSGRTVDTSNVQTFGSGQAVNTVKIKDENGEVVTEPAGVLSAEAGAKVAQGLETMQEGKLVDPHVFVVDYYFNNTTDYICTAGEGRGVLVPVTGGDIVMVYPTRIEGVSTGSAKFIFLDTMPSSIGEALSPITIEGQNVKFISCGTDSIPYAKVKVPPTSKYMLINQRTVAGVETIDNGFAELSVNGVNFVAKNAVAELGYNTLVKTKSIFLTNPAEGAGYIREMYLKGLDANTNYYVTLVCTPPTAAAPKYQFKVYSSDNTEVARLTTPGLPFKGMYAVEEYHDSGVSGYLVADAPSVPTKPDLVGSRNYAFNLGEDNYLIKENCENLDFSPSIRAYLEKSYAVCSTDAATAQKEISKDTYTFGKRMLVKMENVNTASEVTLKVNEETAYPLYYNGSVASSENTWKAGEVLDIYFDGTNYQATSFIGGGSESVEDLNSVIGTGTLKNLVDTLITEWTQGRYGLTNRGFADAETYVRFNGNASGYSVSNEFDVKKGTIIEFDHGSESTIVSQGVIPIVKVEEGSEPTAILMSDNLSDNNALVGITEYRFIVPYDMTIRLGTRNPYNNNSFYKIYESGIQADNDLVRTTYPIAFSGADEYRDLMSQATKVDSYNGSNSELSTGWKDTQVTLLHYSDIHGDLDRLKRILEFRKRYSTPESIIDDIICTGDMCGSRYANYNEAFDTLPGYNRVLQVIGNHDVYDADGTHGSSGYDSQEYYATEQQKFERYMANASTWGVVQPSGAGENGYYPCYYYKDYVANRTYASDDTYKQKVRLIVLDAMIKTTDTEGDIKQKKWFAETLLDAKTNGKHVVVADHFSYRDNNTNHFEAGGFDCMIDEWGGSIGYFGIKMKTYAEIVDYYINGGTYTLEGEGGFSIDFGNAGGEFVCWLCGHFHWDMVGTTTTYPKQVFIAVGSASFRTPMQHRARVIGEESEDLFNIVSIDTFRRHIRVFRVGAKWDRFLAHSGTMCISYDGRGSNVPHLISHF